MENVESMFGTILTGLFGIISTIIGCFLTYYLTKKQFGKENISKDKISYSLYPCSYSDMVRKAQKTIFFSGAGCEVLNDYSLQNILAEINHKISIDIVKSNPNNEDVRLAFQGLTEISREYVVSVNELVATGVDRIKVKRNINVKYIDFFNPISYFAIDCNENSKFSFIQAKHYLISDDKKTVKVFYCTVHPGSDLYDWYREQIILLLKN